MARYAASQSGCPKLEKILTVGMKSAVQQETSKVPLKTRQVGSYPKWEGSPQRATIKPEIRLKAKDLLTMTTAFA